MKGGGLPVLLLCATMAVAAAPAQPAAAITFGPEASFSFAPVLPTIDDAVTFTSTSTAPGKSNAIVGQAWDLDDDKSFDDGTSATAARQFPAPGTYWVRLLVVDKRGDGDVGSQMITVQDRPPAPKPSLLSPFPVVRMSGDLTRRGVLIRRLVVKAPDGAQVIVRCNGRSCPLRQQNRIAANDFRSFGATGTNALRIHRLERRLLRRGVVIKLFITKPGTIGKYVRFQIRRGRAPLRRDDCVAHGSTAPVACPVS